MGLIIFEDSIKYDKWVKPFLVFPLVLLIVLAILFCMDAYYSDIFPKEPGAKSKTASAVLFASTVFVLAIYWLVLPRKIFVTQDGIKIKFSGFSWNIPYQAIKSVKPGEGIIVWWAHSFIRDRSLLFKGGSAPRYFVIIFPSSHHER
jgi:hypothetical protein